MKFEVEVEDKNLDSGDGSSMGEDESMHLIGAGIFWNCFVKAS